MGTDPVRQVLGPCGFGKGIIAGAKHSHKDLGFTDFSADRILDGQGLTRIVDKSLLACHVDLTHGRFELAHKGTVTITKLAVLQTVRMLRLVLLPEQKQSHGTALAFHVNVGPVRFRPFDGTWRQDGKE